MTATQEALHEPQSNPRRPSSSRWIAIGVAAVLVGFLIVLATRESAQNTLAESPLLGQPAPEVIGSALDGSTVRLSSFRGRHVILNFFATWCVPCLREHDDFLRFQEAHRATGDAVILAVIFDDEPDRVRQFFAKKGGEWPVLTDSAGKVSLDFGVRGPPESFLIDPDGIVRSKVTGEITFDGLESLIARASSTGPRR